MPALPSVRVAETDSAHELRSDAKSAEKRSVHLAGLHTSCSRIVAFSPNDPRLRLLRLDVDIRRSPTPTVVRSPSQTADPSPDIPCADISSGFNIHLDATNLRCCESRTGRADRIIA